MAVEALPALLEFLLALVLGVAEVCVLIVVASIRPWRYILSSVYRQRVQDDLRGRSRFARAWYFWWGTVALVASITLVIGSIWLVWPPEASGPRPPKVSERALSEAERLILEKAKALKGDR